jgi:chromosome segregation ATPase
MQITMKKARFIAVVGINFLIHGAAFGAEQEMTDQEKQAQELQQELQQELEQLKEENARIKSELNAKHAALCGLQEKVSVLQEKWHTMYNRNRSFIYNGEHSLADLRALAFEIYSANLPQQTKVDWLCLLAHASSRLSVTLSAQADNKRADDLSYLEKLVKMVAHEIDVEAECQKFHQQLPEKMRFVVG